MLSLSSLTWEPFPCLLSAQPYTSVQWPLEIQRGTCPPPIPFVKENQISPSYVESVFSLTLTQSGLSSCKHTSQGLWKSYPGVETCLPFWKAEKYLYLINGLAVKLILKLFKFNAIKKKYLFSFFIAVTYEKVGAVLMKFALYRRVLSSWESLNSFLHFA